eukprot:Awhi_evm1s7278
MQSKTDNSTRNGTEKSRSHGDFNTNDNYSKSKQYVLYNWLIFFGIFLVVTALNLPFLLKSIQIRGSSPLVYYSEIESQGNDFGIKIDALTALLEGRELSKEQTTTLGVVQSLTLKEDMLKDPLFFAKVSTFFQFLNETTRNEISQDQMSLLDGSVFQTVFLADLSTLQKLVTHLETDMDKISD